MKTGDTEHAGAAAESFVRACPVERWQDLEAAGRSVGRDAGEAAQEHSQTEEPEGTRHRSRDIEKEQRTDAGPLVSVVIPCYNQAHFLGEAIESALAQSHPRFEIVVVDDGSPDDTSEVAARYPGVRCVRQENQGLSAARNTGLRHSKGEYVVFLDADDRLLPEALEAGVKQLSAHPGCAFVSGHIRRIAADGSFLGTPRQALYQAHVEGDHYLGLLHYNSVWIPGSVMFRRAVFNSVGNFDTSVNGAADYDLYLRITREFPVHYHGEVVLEYRRHGTNMTRDPAPMLKATVTVLRSQRKHVKGNKRYKEAYRTGMRTGQEIYGVPLASKVRDHVRKREWERTLWDVLVLLRYHPLGLALLLLNERRMERHVERRGLARRLRAHQQELWARERQLRLHEQRLRALDERPGDRGEQRLKESGSALAKERREVRRLRKRTRRLALELQNTRGSRTRRLLKKLGRVRGRVLGKLRRSGSTRKRTRDIERTTRPV